MKNVVILENSFKTALILVFLEISVQATQYVILDAFFFSTWFGLLLPIVKVIIVLISAYFLFDLRAERFLNKFLYCFGTFYIYELMTIVFLLFLHSYVDTDYRYRLADKKVLVTSKAINDYASKHKFEIEDPTADNEKIRKEIIYTYSTPSILKSIFSDLPFIAIFSLIISLCIFRE